MEEKQKKPFYKKWWVWAIAVVLVIAAASGGGGDTSTPTSGQSSEQKQENTPTPKQEKKNKPTISKDEFDKIKSGMSYEEVKAIIGGDGEVLSESGNPGEQFHTVIYQYEGEGSFGANANLTFQGGKLQNKAQFGLE